MKELKRQLSLPEATIIGLSAMIGSGIFVAFSPASQLAHSAIFISLFLASLIALLNAFSMAKLASLYPLSGGTYIYGREILGDYWGYLAGASFIVGKIASCSAMAFAIGTYLTPDTPKITALISVFVVTFINILGIKKTTFVSGIILLFLVITLLCAKYILFSQPSFESMAFIPKEMNFSYSSILQGAAILFFAFAGYARVATLGEEIQEPQKNIPRAISLSIFLTMGLYFLVAYALFGTLTIEEITVSTAPLADAFIQLNNPLMQKLVRAAAVVACFGVLLSLSAGISRTIFSMARNNDLPTYLTKIGSTNVPIVAQILVGICVGVVIYQMTLMSSISFSSFSILLYYSIAHACVLKLDFNKTFKKLKKCFIIGRTGVGLFLTLSISFSLSSHTIGKSLLILLVLSLIYIANKKWRQKRGS